MDLDKYAKKLMALGLDKNSRAMMDDDDYESWNSCPEGDSVAYWT